MIVCPFGDKYDGLFILYDALYFQTFNPYFIILCHFTQEPWMWIGVSNLWNYVFKGAFFSLSDIRAGAVECDLNRPLPPSSFSWKIQITDVLPFILLGKWEKEKEFEILANNRGWNGHKFPFHYLICSLYSKNKIKHKKIKKSWRASINSLSNKFWIKAIMFKFSRLTSTQMTKGNKCLPHLFLNNLNHIFIMKNMRKATMLWIVSRTCTPHQHIFHFLHQIPVKMVAKVLNGTSTSILKLQTTRRFKEQEKGNRNFLCRSSSTKSQ